MKLTSLIPLAGLSSLLGTASAAAGDIRLADCPAPVRATIEANARGGKIEEVEVVKMGASTLYVADVELIGGLDLNLYVSSGGALEKTKEDIRLTDAPEAVRATVRGLGGRVDDIDKLTTGSTVTYEIDIDRHGQPDLEVIVAADGKVLRQAEDRDDD